MIFFYQIKIDKNYKNVSKLNILNGIKCDNTNQFLFSTEEKNKKELWLFDFQVHPKVVITKNSTV